MIITRDDFLHNFEFWSGAVEHAQLLDYDELDAVGEILEDYYPYGIDEMKINDLFWFHFDEVCELLGYEIKDDGTIDKNPSED